MDESVGNGTVQRQLSADANPHHHEAQLIIEAIAEHFAQIVLNDRKKDREKRHHDTDPDQHLRSGESPCQCVHREFGGEGAEENRAGHGCLRVGILQPVVQERKSTLDSESREYQPYTGADRAEVSIGTDQLVERE